MKAWSATTAAIGLLALSVAFSGTALAAIIISKNAQVAAHTIAGAAAPSGDNKNLIAGSVGTSDIAPGAITTSKLTLPRLRFNGPDSDTGSDAHNVLNLDNLSLDINCIDSGVSGTTAQLFGRSTATAPKLRGLVWGGTTDSAPTTSKLIDQTLSASNAYVGLVAATSGGQTPHVVGMLEYTDGSRVITINYDMTASAVTHKCTLTGTAVPAPN